jgi:hypothetical protein
MPDQEPEFVFPETLTAYRVELARLEEEKRAARETSNTVEGEMHRAGLNSFESAANEIIRRQKHKEWLAEIGKVSDLRERIAQLPRAFRVSELSRYLSEGKEIFRSTTGGVTSNKAFRVVVRWKRKILLLAVRDGSVSWVADSLQQFNDTELEAVARFQASRRH